MWQLKDGLMDNTLFSQMKQLMRNQGNSNKKLSEPDLGRPNERLKRVAGLAGEVRKIERNL